MFTVLRITLQTINYKFINFTLRDTVATTLNKYPHLVGHPVMKGVPM
jgi:hypothetical protein